MLQLLVLSLEQENMLLKHFHGRRHAQRKAVVVDDHGATTDTVFIYSNRAGAILASSE